MASIALDVYARCGLQLSFEKGKTEATICFAGSGAGAARHRLYFELGGKLRIHSDMVGPRTLAVGPLPGDSSI